MKTGIIKIDDRFTGATMNLQVRFKRTDYAIVLSETLCKKENRAAIGKFCTFGDYSVDMVDAETGEVLASGMIDANAFAGKVEVKTWQ